MSVKNLVYTFRILLIITLLFATGCSDEEKIKQPLVVKAVSSYSDYTCVISIDGELWCWGFDAPWLLGGRYRNSPIRIGRDHDWILISCGDTHICGIKTDKTLWCTGANIYGELGDGSYEDRDSFVKIGGEDWTYVSAGMDHTCAIKSDRTLWCWGLNDVGQLGIGTWDLKKSTPTQVGKAEWLSVSAGSGQTCAIKEDRSLWCWGSIYFGIKNAPVKIGEDNDWISVSVGGIHNVALKIDGTIWGWGWNIFEQIVPEMPEDRISHPKTLPVQMGEDSDWLTVFAGGGFSCGIKISGILKCWGYEARHWQIKEEPDEQYVSATGGNKRVCGIKKDGTLWCLGRFVGDGTEEERNTPTQVFYYP